MLNANTKIRVSTGLGFTPWKQVGQCLGQGSLGGALVSANNLGDEFEDYFEDSTEEVCYGSIRLQPMLFQDDAIRLATSRNNDQSGNLKVESIMKSKLLEIHPDKSCYLLLANKTNYDLVQKEISDNPFVYHNFDIKQKSQEKWLGEQLHEQGLSATNLATVISRRGKATAAIFEIKSVLQDIKLHALGGIKCGLEIFELAVVPFLLSNADTWTSLDEKTLLELDKLQVLFLSVLLSVPLSCPRPAVFWDTGSISMENKIIIRKLNLIHHIKSLDDSSIATVSYTHLTLPTKA